MHACAGNSTRSAEATPLPAAGVRSRVLRWTALVVVLFAADKILALVRDAVIGYVFGTSSALDAYYAAFELPDGLFTVIAGSAMATTLIPVVVGYLVQDRDVEVWRLVSTILNWALLIVALVGICAAIFSSAVIRAVAPGFDAGRVQLAARLMRIVLLQTLLFTASGILMGVLRAHQHFLLPALAPTVYTLSRILGAVLLAPHWGIFGLAWGGVFGAVVYLLVLIPGLVRYRARWWPTLYHPDLRRVLSLMAPRMLGLGTTYLSFVLPTFLGSHLPAGAIAAYEYAWRLMQFPETLIGTALGFTVFPVLAELATAGRVGQLRAMAMWGVRMVLTVAVPAALGLILLGQPLTALFLQRGAFDSRATERVAWALQFLSLGLVAHSVLEVVSNLFYAQQDMWTPLWAAVAGLVLNASLGWLLLPLLAHGSIALGNSVGVTLQVVLLLCVARRRLGGIEGKRLLRLGGRMAAVTALMALAVIAFQGAFPGSAPQTIGVVGAVLGAAVYFVASYALGSEELRHLVELLARRRLPAAQSEDVHLGTTSEAHGP